MLTDLTQQPEDKILALMALYRADPRPVKIDLGVGVYKNAQGQTPVMKAVKMAEETLWREQESKSYVGLAGDPEFADAMRQMVLGDAVDAENVAAVATPGGTGAIRQGLELIKMANPDATIWLSDPTWANHPSIIKYLGMNQATYRYFDAEACTVNFDGMMEDLAKVKAGDVVLLHGCCHNPTGANLRPSDFQTVIDMLNKTGAVPFVDIAYQGFGDGLDKDAAFTRAVVSGCEEAIIAASCSKNFGIYRERTGILFATSNTSETRDLAQKNMAFLNRQNFSFPPDHGARLVTMILGDDTLRTTWAEELEAVRLGMLSLRVQLAEALQKETGSDRFGFIADHRGMFSRVGVSAEAVKTMREDHAIYMVGDSRINIAGLNAETIPLLAQAIAKTL